MLVADTEVLDAVTEAIVVVVVITVVGTVCTWCQHPMFSAQAQKKLTTVAVCVEVATTV